MASTVALLHIAELGGDGCVVVVVVLVVDVEVEGVPLLVVDDWMYPPAMKVSNSSALHSSNPG
jgi:hypothetical protein